MNYLILGSVINFLHLFATVAWFGAMTTNAFILLPSARKALEAPLVGKLIGAVMKRFRVLVYISIGQMPQVSRPHRSHPTGNDGFRLSGHSRPAMFLPTARQGYKPLCWYVRLWAFES